VRLRPWGQWAAEIHVPYTRHKGMYSASVHPVYSTAKLQKTPRASQLTALASLDQATRASPLPEAEQTRDAGLDPACGARGGLLRAKSSYRRDRGRRPPPPATLGGAVAQ
jgi:hypothetical protein